jgi:vacuolar protein sorting-associated protein 72
MSDDERSDSDGGSDRVDLSTTGLVATRARRSNAGNLYASLRAHLDDEELQRELLAEDEDDEGEYESSVKEDDDEALESEDEEEDAGPPAEGEEDLEGEKELKRTERAEARKKRKVQDARLKLPAWQKKTKRVKLADDVKTEDGASPAPKPRKKSERANWLPTAADAPTRQSSRSLAVANREVVHASLTQSAERSEKQRKVMKDAAEREKLKKRAEISQERRMEMCEKIAKQTEKEFGRWEREEAERQRRRDEELARKRKRGLDGPFIRHWSGSVVWVGNQIKEHRVPHGSKKIEEIEEVKEVPRDSKAPESAAANAAPAVTPQPTQPALRQAGPSQISQPPPRIQVDYTTPSAGPSSLPNAQPAPQPTPTTSSTASMPWLEGIHDYASQPLPQPSTQQPPLQTPYTPHTTFQSSSQPTPGPSTITYQTPRTYTWTPNRQPHTTVSIPPQPPPAPVPLLREQAQRTLILLSSFPNLSSPGDKRRHTSRTTAAFGGGSLDPTDIAKVLLPESYPTFTPEEAKYLTTKPKSRSTNLPPVPPKMHCAIISSEKAKFRDPKTGLGYSDLSCYQVIQRVLNGECQWSGLLGAWVGPFYGKMGRAAHGVPAGFEGREEETKKEGNETKEAESEEIKAEGGAS